MTTQAQIDANRLNAQKSTGPRTPEGREQSRRNALKHGLSGQGIVLPAEEGAAFDTRRAEWNSSLRPFDVLDVWVSDVVVRASLQLDRCCAHEQILRTRWAERAANDDHWEVDRRISAEALGRDLPRNPSMVIRQLKRSPQGADWIIERWEGLALILEQKGDWTEKQRRLALDLLGTPPELREGPTKLDPKPGDHKAHRQSIIEFELARLRELKVTRLADMDESDRALAELGVKFDMPRSLMLLRRYEAACERRLLWGLNRLRKGASSGPEPRPVPAYRPPVAPAPAPAPPPAPPAPLVPAPAPSSSGVTYLDIRAIPLPPEPPMNRTERKQAYRAGRERRLRDEARQRELQRRS